RRHIFFLEDVKDCGSPARIRAVIEREYDLLLRCTADLVDIVGERIFFVGFVDKEIGGRFVIERTAARFRNVGKMPNIATAFEGQIRSWRNLLDFLASR